MPAEDPKRMSTVLSEVEVKRYFERLDSLSAFSRLFPYDSESDRAIAVVGAAFLDYMLREILVEFMIDDPREVEKLMQPEGPLGTFGSRITACYCLGQIGKIVVADLRLVAKIRNRFAHDLRATFSDSPISQWCRALRWHRQTMFRDPPENATDRDYFQVGVNQLVTYLNAIPGLAKFEKRVPRRDGSA